jgi:glutathionylspermidine synthase
MCGKQKGTVDHWWLAWIEKYQPHNDAASRQLFKIYPWENMMAHDASAKHLCGQACLHKYMDRWIDESMHPATAHPHAHARAV